MARERRMRLHTADAHAAGFTHGAGAGGGRGGREEQRGPPPAARAPRRSGGGAQSRLATRTRGGPRQERGAPKRRNRCLDLHPFGPTRNSGEYGFVWSKGHSEPLWGGSCAVSAVETISCNG